jgi:teichuronic acid biosynthesis glycosyltransferase TuaC
MNGMNCASRPTPASKPLHVLMVTGIYPTEQLPDRGTFIKSQVDSLIMEGLRIEVVHPKLGPVLYRYFAATIQVFLKTLLGHFDVVHGHYGTWCLVARLQWRTPVVASFLGSDLLGIKTSTSSNSSKGKLFSRLSRWLAHRTDAVIVKSEEMKKTIAEKNVFIIPNGIDFDLFQPVPRSQARATLGWDPDRVYILFGNNPARPVKNFPLAQAALTHLRAQGIDAHLVVASGLPQSQVVLYLNACNALLLPSITEGSPNIVKESMACNVPVVSTDVGDVAQVIGRTEGCSVCASDPQALASGLARALRHAGPTSGRADIQHLERSVIARQVIAVYEQVLCTRQKRRQCAPRRRNEDNHVE